jgi:hypothetical protein
MFCDQCGTQLQAEQARCARCGKQVVGALQYGRNRVREHIKLLGILWMAYSAMYVVGGVGILLISKLVIVHLGNIPNGPPPELMAWLPTLVSVVGWMTLAKAAAGIITGWGLLQHEDWARVLALVMGFLALLSVPVGTALGIYTLWVLLPAQSEEEYKSLPQAA